MLAPGVGVVSMGSLGQHSALLPQAHQLTSTSPPTLPSLQRSLSAAEATTAAQQQQLYHYYGYSSTAASAPVPTMAAASPNEYLFGSAQPQPPHGLSALSTASSTHVSPAHSFPLALTRHIHAHAPLCIVYTTRTHVQPPGACGCAVTVHDHCRCTPYHGRAPRWWWWRWRRRQQQPHQHKQQQQQQSSLTRAPLGAAAGTAPHSQCGRGTRQLLSLRRRAKEARSWLEQQRHRRYAARVQRPARQALHLHAH